MDIIFPLAIVGSTAALFWALYQYSTGPKCRSRGGCRLAAVGDSITAGGYPGHLRELLRGRYTVDSSGNVGYGSGAIATVLRNQVLPRNYDEIIIQAGANDLGRPNAQQVIFDNIRQMVSLAKDSGARVILLSLPPWSRAADQIREINRQLRLRAPFWGVDQFVDIWSPLADDQGGLRADLIGDRMGVHPNSSGQRLIAEEIYWRAF